MKIIGLDLGTSSLKAVLLDGEASLAEAEIPLATDHLSPLASEQDPDLWWRAAEAALAALSAKTSLSGVAAIGLAGQMHALALFDAADRPVRPAMLWNDGRAHAEAAELNHADLAATLGVPATAGFTGPKLLWLARQEPEAFGRARHLLLPKDVIRLHLTGERATDLSDAAGTWLLDQAAGAWSAAALALVGCPPGLLPSLVESTAITGTIRPELAGRFGLPAGIVVAGGGGDTPVGGIGMGVVEDGDAFINLGTSAQLFVAADAHRPAPARMVHAFRHALPGRFYQMAALLNGASVPGFFARLLGADIAPLLARAEAGFRGPSHLLVLPYLAGERTPHDDPRARGVVFGLTAETTPAQLAQAALEGVAFSLADGRDALAEAGTPIASAALIGGGSRDAFWARIIAAVLGIPLRRYAGGARGPAFGAARLARLALGEGDLRPPPVTDVIEPDPDLTSAYAPRLAAFRRLYAALRPEFAA